MQHDLQTIEQIDLQIVITIIFLTILKLLDSLWTLPLIYLASSALLRDRVLRPYGISLIVVLRIWVQVQLQLK